MAITWRITYSGEDRDKQLQFRVKERKGKFLALNYLSGEEFGEFASVDEAKDACEKHVIAAPKPQPPEQAEAKPAAHAPPKHEPPKHDPPPRTTRR